MLLLLRVGQPPSNEQKTAQRLRCLLSPFHSWRSKVTVCAVALFRWRTYWNICSLWTKRTVGGQCPSSTGMILSTSGERAPMVLRFWKSCACVTVWECMWFCACHWMCHAVCTHVCGVCMCQGRDNSSMYVKAVRVGLVSTKCNLSLL